MLDSQIIQILTLYFIEGLSALEIFEKLEDPNINYQNIVNKCNSLVDKNIAEIYINKDNIKIYKLVCGI